MQRQSKRMRANDAGDARGRSVAGITIITSTPFRRDLIRWIPPYLGDCSRRALFFCSSDNPLVIAVIFHRRRLYRCLPLITRGVSFAGTAINSSSISFNRKIHWNCVNLSPAITRDIFVFTLSLSLSFFLQAISFFRRWIIDLRNIQWIQ